MDFGWIPMASTQNPQELQYSASKCVLSLFDLLVWCTVEGDHVRTLEFTTTKIFLIMCLFASHTGHAIKVMHLNLQFTERHQSSLASANDVAANKGEPATYCR